VPPTDSEAVADLLRCSVRWAESLTRSARERERILEDQRLQAARDEGKTVRQIAEQTGLHNSTVTRRLAAKTKASHLQQPIEADPNDPRQVDIEDVLAEPAAPTQADIVRANLARMEAPEVKDWHRALEAMRQINAQSSAPALFLDRYRGFDHAIGPELRQAREWINDTACRGVRRDGRRILARRWLPPLACGRDCRTTDDRV
jgi:transposase